MARARSGVRWEGAWPAPPSAGPLALAAPSPRTGPAEASTCSRQASIRRSSSSGMSMGAPATPPSTPMACRRFMRYRFRRLDAVVLKGKGIQAMDVEQELPNLTRRQALKATGAASLGLIAPGGGPLHGRAHPHADRSRGLSCRRERAVEADAQGGPEPLVQAGITQSVARWCFAAIPLPEFCTAVGEIGLRAMDLLTVDEWAVAYDHGLVVSCGDVGAGTIEDGLNEPRNHPAIIAAFEEHIPRAAREGVPNVICFFGNRRGMSDGPAIENSVRCLRECAPIAEAEGVTILVEVLNSKPGGHVDYIGDRMPYALEVMRAVNSSTATASATQVSISVDSSSSGALALSILTVKTKSRAVHGMPSLHWTPARILMVISV